MTEDVLRFLHPGEIDDRTQAPTLARAPGWHLSDDDLSQIDTLHALFRSWLSLAQDSRTVQDVAKALAALEDIAAGRMPSVLLEISVSHKPDFGDGLAVNVHMADLEIELSVTEWVWMSVEQGHDHAFRTDATLTARGSFDPDRIDVWCLHEETVTANTEATLTTHDERGEV